MKPPLFSSNYAWNMRQLWRAGYQKRQWAVYPNVMASSRGVTWCANEEIAKKILAWKLDGPPRYRHGNRTTRKEP